VTYRDCGRYAEALLTATANAVGGRTLGKGRNPFRVVGNVKTIPQGRLGPTQATAGSSSEGRTKSETLARFAPPKAGDGDASAKRPYRAFRIPQGLNPNSRGCQPTEDAPRWFDPIRGRMFPGTGFHRLHRRLPMFGLYEAGRLRPVPVAANVSSPKTRRFPSTDGSGVGSVMFGFW
jgi:hypothetical protein